MKSLPISSLLIFLVFLLVYNSILGPVIHEVGHAISCKLFLNGVASISHTPGEYYATKCIFKEKNEFKILIFSLSGIIFEVLFAILFLLSEKTRIIGILILLGISINFIALNYRVDLSFLPFYYQQIIGIFLLLTVFIYLKGNYNL